MIIVLDNETFSQCLDNISFPEINSFQKMKISLQCVPYYNLFLNLYVLETL